MTESFRYVSGQLVEHLLDGKPKIKTSPKVATIFGPMPPDQWPIWVKALKAMATPEEKGIGDVVARMIGDEKSDAFKAWHLATFGKACNCTARRELWNRLYPLP